MSTTFKIIENNIQTSRSKISKTNSLLSPHQLTPKSHSRMNDNDSSMDEEEILRMEIKQLQRQNKFLKKKINELTSELNGDNCKKSKVTGKGATVQSLDPTQMTIEFFFKQINSLLNSLVQLFKIEFTDEQARMYSQQFPVITEVQNGSKRFAVFKKFILARKLQKVSLLPEQKRYTALLDTFQQFYIERQNSEKEIRQIVDSLSSRAMGLNKMIFEHKCQRRSQMMSSCVRSLYTNQNSVDKMDPERKLSTQCTPSLSNDLLHTGFGGNSNISLSDKKCRTPRNH